MAKQDLDIEHIRKTWKDLATGVSKVSVASEIERLIGSIDSLTSSVDASLEALDEVLRRCMDIDERSLLKDKRSALSDLAVDISDLAAAAADCHEELAQQEGEAAAKSKAEGIQRKIEEQLAIIVKLGPQMEQFQEAASRFDELEKFVELGNNELRNAGYHDLVVLPARAKLRTIMGDTTQVTQPSRCLNTEDARVLIANAKQMQARGAK